MVSECLKDKFEADKGKSWDKASKSERDVYLLSDEQSVNWFSKWKPIAEKHKTTPYKTVASLKKDLATAEKSARLRGALVCGGGGGGTAFKDVSAIRRELKNKYNI